MPSGLYIVRPSRLIPARLLISFESYGDKNATFVHVFQGATFSSSSCVFSTTCEHTWPLTMMQRGRVFRFFFIDRLGLSVCRRYLPPSQRYDPNMNRMEIWNAHGFLQVPNLTQISIDHGPLPYKSTFSLTANTQFGHIQVQATRFGNRQLTKVVFLLLDKADFRFPYK